MIEPKSPPKKPFLTRNRVLAVAALLAVIALAFFMMRPKLTPEQQLRADMSGLERAVENTSPRDVLHYIADDFKWNDTDREGFSRLLKSALIEASQIEATRTSETYDVRGDSGTVSGSYTARYRRIREARHAPMNTLLGEYSIQWQLRDGAWKIVSATGSEGSTNRAPATEPLF
jgi:hypothetical protein